MKGKIFAQQKDITVNDPILKQFATLLEKYEHKVSSFKEGNQAQIELG